MNRVRIIKDFILENDFRMDDISVKRENAVLHDASSRLRQRRNIFSRSNDSEFS